MFDSVIRNGQLVLPDGAVVAGNVGILQGRIAALSTAPLDGREVIDAGDRHVIPGVIDPHMHFGFHSPTEDVLTETRAAALGGVTTAVRIHRLMRPYHDLADEIALMSAKVFTDFTLHLGLMIEEHVASLPQYVQEFGITSFKIYMAYRGVEGEQLGIQGADDGFLFDALSAVAKYPRAVVALHAENWEIIDRRRRQLQAAGRTDLPAWTECRPDYAEAEAIRRVGYFAKRTGCPIYVLHVTSREGLEAAERLRAEGVRIGIEFLPQHLTHNNQSELGSVAKENPPLRTPEDQAALWAFIGRSATNTIASDHCALTIAEKRKGLWDCIPGFPGSPMILPVMLSEGVNKGRLTMGQLAAVTAGNAARICNLPSKGAIRIGADADLVVVDLALEREVRAADVGSAVDLCLYEGWRLRGWPTLTMLRGQVVARDGKIVASPGCGQFVRRET